MTRSSPIRPAPIDIIRHGEPPLFLFRRSFYPVPAKISLRSSRCANFVFEPEFLTPRELFSARFVEYQRCPRIWPQCLLESSRICPFMCPIYRWVCFGECHGICSSRSPVICTIKCLLESDLNIRQSCPIDLQKLLSF